MLAGMITLLPCEFIKHIIVAYANIKGALNGNSLSDCSVFCSRSVKTHSNDIFQDLSKNIRHAVFVWKKYHTTQAEMSFDLMGKQSNFDSSKFGSRKKILLNTFNKNIRQIVK